MKAVSTTQFNCIVNYPPPPPFQLIFEFNVGQLLDYEMHWTMKAVSTPQFSFIVNHPLFS